MSKLIISTQVYENYGAHDWDGVSPCPQYWKAKGGRTFVVINVDPLLYGEGYEWSEVYKDRLMATLADEYGLCECNDYWDEALVGCDLVEDDHDHMDGAWSKPIVVKLKGATV